jgi:flagellar hook assembly protein FlgD
MANISIYDQRGRLVRMLVDGSMPAGAQSAVWDGQDRQGRAAPSGTYIVRLVTDQGVRSSKLTLAR